MAYAGPPAGSTGSAGPRGAGSSGTVAPAQASASVARPGMSSRPRARPIARVLDANMAVFLLDRCRHGLRDLKRNCGKRGAELTRRRSCVLSENFRLLPAYTLPQ